MCAVLCCAEGEAEAAGAGDRGTAAADRIADQGAGAMRQGDAGDGPWTLRSLRRGFGDRLFKVGEDDDGYKVRVKMKHFLRYLAANRDDSPLYVFDGESQPIVERAVVLVGLQHDVCMYECMCVYVCAGSFDDDERSRALLRGYQVPRFFRDDLLGLVGERRRPPYRFLALCAPLRITCRIS